jgi:molybdate transport system substrate-binding protein
MRPIVTLLMLVIASNAAAEQTLTVLSSNATSELIHELAPHFKKACGCDLHVKFDNSAALKTRIESGELFDVAVMTSTLIGDLAMSGKLAPASRRDVARAGAGTSREPASAWRFIRWPPGRTSARLIR